MTRWVTPARLKESIGDRAELALLDVREQGAFSTGHLFLASCLPLSRLEIGVDALVPRRGVRMVLCDGGEDGSHLARAASARLADLGFAEPGVLEGGVQGWQNQGYELFSGVNVPSKAFGEFVERTYHTPHLTAEELRARLERREKITVLDARPLEEYRRMCIPGGIDVPGAELVYRVSDIATDPDALVVVNCAGRTRSIIGAQSLINAGIPQRVAALKDGTMGWQLAGYSLEHDQDRQAPEPSAAALQESRAAAERVARRFGVRTLTRVELEVWRAEESKHTLYLLDVRSPQEYAAGHLPGSRSAPGGQLVQATDEFMATRNARIVLVDDTQVRSTLTASWLIQLGWDEVRVLEGGLQGIELERSDSAAKPLGFREARTLSAHELEKELADGESIVVLDLASSAEFRAAHIPGAWWGVRARLGQCLERAPDAQSLILTSPDATLAHLGAGDLAGSRAGVRVLAGGTRAWLAAGFPTEPGLEKTTTVTDDVWFRPYEHRNAMERWMREYLLWEVGLLEQIERDGDAGFRSFEGAPNTGD